MIRGALKRYERYKDSGVEWLGKVPAHWEVKRLKDIGNSIIGITYSPEDVLDDGKEGVLVLRSSNIQNSKLCLKDTVFVNIRISKKQTVRQGDILICSRNGSRALIGKNIIIDELLAGNTFGAFMTVYRSKYFRFIHKFFNSKIFESQSGLYMSSTVNQLTINTLNNFFIALPPMVERKSIATYLEEKTERIDKKIELLNRKADRYRELKQALINETVTRGLDPTVPMKDSGVEWIGEVPAHWEVKRLKELAEICGGKDYKTVELVEGGYPVYGSGGVFARAKECLYSKESVLLGRKGTIDKPLYVTEPFWTVDTMYYTTINKITLPKFFYYLCITIDFGYYQCGSAVPSMTQTDLRRIQFTCPDYNEQQAIVTYLDAKTAQIDQIITTITTQIQTLQELRKTLINDVVTGKIKVV